MAIPSWCNIEPIQGSSGTTSVNISAEANNGRESRSGEIVFTENKTNTKVVCNISQEGIGDNIEITSVKYVNTDDGTVDITPGDTSIKNISYKPTTVIVTGNCNRTNLEFESSKYYDYTKYALIVNKESVIKSSVYNGINYTLPIDIGKEKSYPFEIRFSISQNFGRNYRYAIYYLKYKKNNQSYFSNLVGLFSQNGAEEFLTLTSSKITTLSGSTIWAPTDKYSIPQEGYKLVLNGSSNLDTFGLDIDSSTTYPTINISSSTVIDSNTYEYSSANKYSFNVPFSDTDLGKDNKFDFTSEVTFDANTGRLSREYVLGVAKKSYDDVFIRKLNIIHKGQEFINHTGGTSFYLPKTNASFTLKGRCNSQYIYLNYSSGYYLGNCTVTYKFINASNESNTSSTTYNFTSSNTSLKKEVPYGYGKYEDYSYEIKVELPDLTFTPVGARWVIAIASNSDEGSMSYTGPTISIQRTT